MKENPWLVMLLIFAAVFTVGILWNARKPILKWGSIFAAITIFVYAWPVPTLFAIGAILFFWVLEDTIAGGIRKGLRRT